MPFAVYTSANVLASLLLMNASVARVVVSTAPCPEINARVLPAPPAYIPLNVAS